MTIHNIKILKVFAEAVAKGDKTFEIRENDRGYQKGDHIRFKTIDRSGILVLDSPLDNKEYEITYILNGWGLRDGWVVLAIKEVQK